MVLQSITAKNSVKYFINMLQSYCEGLQLILMCALTFSKYLVISSKTPGKLSQNSNYSNKLCVHNFTIMSSLFSYPKSYSLYEYSKTQTHSPHIYLHYVTTMIYQYFSIHFNVRKQQQIFPNTFRSEWKAIQKSQSTEKFLTREYS